MKNNIINLIYCFGVLFLIFFFIYSFNDFILHNNYDLQTIIQNVIKFAKYQLFSINFVELFTFPIYFFTFWSTC